MARAEHPARRLESDHENAVELVVLVGEIAQTLREACNRLHKLPNEVVLEALLDYYERAVPDLNGDRPER